MGTVTSSGVISLNAIKEALGGPTSPALSNYYRGGAYTPSTKTVSTVVREPSSGEYYNYPIYGWVRQSETNFGYIRWNNTTITDAAGFSAASYTSGGWTYYRGSHRDFQNDENGWGIYYAALYRQQGSTTNVSINTGVPSSGQISMSQFYGAEKP